MALSGMPWMTVSATNSASTRQLWPSFDRLPLQPQPTHLWLRGCAGFGVWTGG